MSSPVRNLTAVGFEIEQRATGFYFRATHNRDAAWHGPYYDAEDVAEMLCFYTREHLLEHFEPIVSDAAAADI